jgi:hypothetical protein
MRGSARVSESEAPRSRCAFVPVIQRTKGHRWFQSARCLLRLVVEWEDWPLPGIKAHSSGHVQPTNSRLSVSFWNSR